MASNVGNAVVTQSIIFKDTSSTSYGTADGYSFCSPRTYTFSGPS
jgi:hypothetical protein